MICILVTACGATVVGSGPVVVTYRRSRQKDIASAELPRQLYGSKGTSHSTLWGSLKSRGVSSLLEA